MNPLYLGLGAGAVLLGLAWYMSSSYMKPVAGLNNREYWAWVDIYKQKRAAAAAAQQTAGYAPTVGLREDATIYWAKYYDKMKGRPWSL